MEETLLIIEEYQVWIYAILGLVGLLYLRLALQGVGDLRRALFGLERERATGRLTRAAAVLALILAAGLATFIVATFAAPSMPASLRPTALPTVSLLTTPNASATQEGEEFEAATPIAVDGVDISGCLNPDATMTSPSDGDSIQGVVEIVGTADIESFAFYKYEFRTLTDGESWRAIGAGTEPVTDNTLGNWDTSLVNPDAYVLRLVVTDTQGNAPMPCAIQVRVLPSPDGN